MWSNRLCHVNVNCNLIRCHLFMNHFIEDITNCGPVIGPLIVIKQWEDNQSYRKHAHVSTVCNPNEVNVIYNFNNGIAINRSTSSSLDNVFFDVYLP